MNAPSRAARRSCAVLNLLVSHVTGRRVGALLLKGEWQEAVSTIMQPRGDAEANEVSEARRLYCDHGTPHWQLLKLTCDA